MTIESPRCEAACSSLKFLGVRRCRLLASRSRALRMVDRPDIVPTFDVCHVHAGMIDAGKGIEIASPDANGDLEAVAYERVSE